MHSSPDQLTATMLTSLGWANYKLKNITDALRFYEQCTKISGPLQQNAQQSIVSIKSEYALQ